MMFIYFTDDEESEIGIPLTSIVELKFDKDGDDPECDELRIEVEDAFYELTGKAARKAWDEIRIQIQASGKESSVNR